MKENAEFVQGIADAIGDRERCCPSFFVLASLAVVSLVIPLPYADVGEADNG